ncbi:MAG: PQQ-dependent sugar dehydrogenase [Thermoleophilia bacterium]|nr:PQQ-dependent sugar dehydrogenase [Thermoleophilia bacterium]
MPLPFQIGAALAALALVPLACGGGEREGDRPATSGGGPTTTETEPVETESAAPPPSEPRRLRLQEVASGLESPTHATSAPGDRARIYVVEQAGRIRVVEAGRVATRPFLDIVDQVASGGEQGLFSVAFHPEYEENGRLYVDYTNLEGDTRVVEYRANRDRTAVDERSARELLAVDQPFANHNGGQLAFGPDGLLYVGMGDGGGAGDPDNRGQNLGDRLGKLLRIDVDDPDADWETVAYGLRNPWRFSFDRANGDLYLADVGQGAREEVDYVRWPLAGLLNFGWDVFEGDLPYEEKELNPEGRLVDPVAVYGRDGGCSVTGGFVYRGEGIPGLAGRYFYGDYCTGNVWSFRVRGGRARAERRERFRIPFISSFGEDGDGELLLVSLTGTVYRLAT